MPPGAGSRDRQTCSGTACAILDYEGTILARGGPILARGLTSIIGSTWGSTGGSPGWCGRVTCAPGSRHVTAELEVALPAPYWIAVGTILLRGGAIRARGLMSLIGSTWGDPWVSRGQHGRVTYSPGWCHVTSEPEVARPTPSWIAAGSILARGGTILPWGLMSLTGRIWDVPGRSRGRRERVSCPPPPGQGHVTADLEVAWPAPSVLGSVLSYLGSSERTQVSLYSIWYLLSELGNLLAWQSVR